MEHVRVLADDLRSVNEHRRMPSDVSRARLFKAHCLCRLRETVESSAIDCGGFLEVLHRAERGLIADASCGLTLTHQIDQALERFCTDLRRLEEDALERDRRRMADLPFQNIVGAKASPHRKLITVRIRTFSGAEFQVGCGLDENLICLKEYIHASGGPRARDQQLVWSRGELAWIQSLETRASDSFSLFYLGITALADAWNVTVVDRVAPAAPVDKFAQAACSVRGASVRTVTGKRACAAGCAKCAENRVLHVIRSVGLMLYSLATPNGWKVGILLEELGVSYDAHVVNIGAGQQFSSGFVGANPNSKIPALIDHSGPDGKAIAVMEAAAIMIYLVEKQGSDFYPKDARLRCECLQWLFWQTGGQGPMTGNFGHFKVYAPPSEVDARNYGVARYGMEVQRICSVLDRHLAGYGDFTGNPGLRCQGPRQYLVGDSYSISDMAESQGTRETLTNSCCASASVELCLVKSKKGSHLWILSWKYRQAVPVTLPHEAGPNSGETSGAAWHPSLCRFAEAMDEGLSWEMSGSKIVTVPVCAFTEDIDDNDDIDFAALTEVAQHQAATLTGDGDDRKKRRAGARESAKRRKRQKRENDLICVKQAGIALPSLKDVLKGSSKPAIVIPSLKEALRTAGAAQATEATVAEGAEPAKAHDKDMQEQSAPTSQPSELPPTTDGGETEKSLAQRSAVSYEDVDEQPVPAEPTAASSDVVDQSRLQVAISRVAKDSERRARVAKATNSRSVFITNLPFKAQEEEIRSWLEKAGEIKGLRLNRDKVTTKALGFGHVQFESSQVADAAVEQCDKVELHGRVMRVAPVDPNTKFQFELPENIKEDLLGLMREAYEGKNISTIKDAWQKRHPGQKLDTAKWGFKNFSSSLKTLEGVTLEHHLEKTLTYLAFFEGSPAHKAYLEERSKRQAEGKVAENPGEAKRAAAEADVLKPDKKPKVENGSSHLKEGPGLCFLFSEGRADDSRSPGPVEIFEENIRARASRKATAKKFRSPPALEAWLDATLETQKLSTKAACPERLKVHREALAWLCDLLPTYGTVLSRVLDEVDGALHRLETWQGELQKMHGLNRTLQSQLRSLRVLHKLQVEEAWSVTKRSSEAETQPVAAPMADSQKLDKDAQAEVTKRRHAERKSHKLQSELQSVRHQLQELEIKEADKVAAKDEMNRLIEQREQISRKNDAQWTETANSGLHKERSQLQSDLRKCEPQRSQQENDQLKQQLNSPSAWYKCPVKSEECRQLQTTQIAGQGWERGSGWRPTASSLCLAQPGIILSIDFIAADAEGGELARTPSVKASTFSEISTTLAIQETDYVPDRPDGMAFQATATMRGRQKWTLSIDEWDRVLTFCQEQEAYQVFKSHGKKYVNMYDLNQEYVKPWTRGEGCGVAVMMSQHREDSAQLMLSHAWAEDVEECQSAVMEHVREAQLPRDAAVWFCLFANYQVGDDSGPSIEAQLSLKPFASVISAASLRRGTGYGLHAIHTSTADLYQRLWCVHEVERALKGDIDVSTSMSDKYKEQTLQRLQFFLSESCGTSTWEDCMWAANVKVKTIQARCDRMEDEQMLIAEIMATGGFERIDATIERFRAETFGQNYELMLKAVGRHGQALKFASFERLERKLIHNLVRSSGASLAHAPVDLKADKDLVIEAVRQNGMALQYAAEEMRVDREVVLNAVQSDGLALQFASGPALMDHAVVLAAVAQDGEAFRLAPDSMKKNREIMEKAVSTSPKALAYVPSELQKDALEVVKSSPEVTAGPDATRELVKCFVWKAVLQLERLDFRMSAECATQEQEVERMEEMAVTRRHAKESEKEQERLQKWLDLMKSVRPQVRTEKPKRALRLMLLGLDSLFQNTQDPSVISRARQAIEKQFDTTTDEDKMDYVDVLLDNSIAMHATLKNSLFKCLVEYKLKLADKAGATLDPKTSSSPVRRYSMHVPKLEPTPSMESERSERHSGRAVTAATKIQVDQLAVAP
ncbi:yghU [Symbiodinium sp. CCMP2456]|nr:yghU [Symbiodinium sp. CCMP2456]